MASLRIAAQDVLCEARDGICWIAVWKTGRSWNTMTFWPMYDERTGRFSEVDKDDLEQLQNIVSVDPNAIFLNGYYFNLGSLEEMTRDSLTNAIRWHYEDIRDAQLKDALISLCDASKQLPPIKEFDSSTAKRGQEVAPEVYEDFLCVLPPISLNGGQGCPAGFQMGEPYCHREDIRTGKWRPMFITFTRYGDRCYYQGINFAGEVDSRPYVKL